MGKTATQKTRMKAKYLDLIRHFPLRPIRSEKELDKAIQVMDSLLDLGALSSDEQDYLDVLADLVERYETDHHPIPPLSDADLLRHLIEAKETTQVQVAQAAGIAESTLSELLSGKRSLNRTQIAKLSRFFHVEPGVFYAD
jgi:HTH-type transcriptional regulator / antitoxin HigA